MKKKVKFWTRYHFRGECRRPLPRQWWIQDSPFKEKAGPPGEMGEPTYLPFYRHFSFKKNCIKSRQIWSVGAMVPYAIPRSANATASTGIWTKMLFLFYHMFYLCRILYVCVCVDLKCNVRANTYDSLSRQSCLHIHQPSCTSILFWCISCYRRKIQPECSLCRHHLELNTHTNTNQKDSTEKRVLHATNAMTRCLMIPMISKQKLLLVQIVCSCFPSMLSKNKM